MLSLLAGVFDLLESVSVAESECCLGGTRNIHNPTTTHSLLLPFLATAFGASVCFPALPILFASYLHAYAIHPIPRYQTFPQFFSLFTDLEPTFPQIELGKSIMLRQSPSRNQRSKGFKLKPVLQICVLLVICIWLLYQVKHFCDKMAYEGSSKRISEKVGSGHQIMRLGRKDLNPELLEKGLENERQGEGKEDPEDEEEESRAEENGDEARGAGDDEMDGHDQDRLEEDESEQGDDFVDEEEDKEDREGETERYDVEGSQTG